MSAKGSGKDGKSATGAAPARMGELGQRVISGVILVALAVGATVAGGAVFAAICAIGAILILGEFTGIVRGQRFAPVSWPAYGALAITAGIFLLWGALASLIALVFLVFSLSAAGWFARREIWNGVGLSYAGLPAIALVVLRADTSVGLHAVLMLFGCVWGADTFAYFAGRLIGGPKLAPAISPKKTWSGLVGGLLGAVLVAMLILHLSGYRLAPQLAFLALVLAFTSALGDLFESWLKRRFGVKDSGNLIPGHGGFMDRVDGLVFSAVVMLAAAWAVAGSAAFSPGSSAGVLLGAFVLP